MKTRRERERERERDLDETTGEEHGKSERGMKRRGGREVLQVTEGEGAGDCEERYTDGSLPTPLSFLTFFLLFCPCPFYSYCPLSLPLASVYSPILSSLLLSSILHFMV